MNSALAITTTDEVYESKAIFSNTESDSCNSAFKSIASVNNLATSRNQFENNSLDIAYDIKSYNRQLTLKSLVPEEQNLVARRQSLAEKMFSADGLSKAENIELRYISWQLDRIDDAKHGEKLDKLEAMIQLQERNADELRHITSQFNRYYSAQSNRNDRQFRNRR